MRAPATRLCATTRKQGRNNAPGNTVQAARANSWPSARPQLRARHVPALPHANQRCRTYSQQLHSTCSTGLVLRIATEPRAPAAPNHKALPGCVAGSLQDAPCANIRSEALTEALFLQRQLAQRVC
ncbi:hypothetical protein HDV63DRAFT_379692 [Trichoderma sp. SZMC 28014]